MYPKFGSKFLKESDAGSATGKKMGISIIFMRFIPFLNFFS